MALGVLDTSTKSEQHQNDDLLGFLNMNPKSYYSQMKQNKIMELLGYLFFDSTMKMAPRPSPDPQTVFVRIPGFSIGSCMDIESLNMCKTEMSDICKSLEVGC